MRKAIKYQMSFGCPDISKIIFDLDCRHEIIPSLIGLQYIYSRPRLFNKVMKLIAEDVVTNKSVQHGAPGMDYWEILVLSSVRHGSNLDYDALHDLANNHSKLRQILGLGVMDARYYKRSTLQDNISAIKDTTVIKISDLIVGEGHKTRPTAIEAVRGDSFVVQTNIHYPTDANLILDGIKKVLSYVFSLANILSIVGWRQHKHWYKKAKRINRKIQRIANSKHKSRETKLKSLYKELLDLALEIIKRCNDTIDRAKELSKGRSRSIKCMVICSLISELESCIKFTERQCDHAYRRIFFDETIPHKEKVFSLFESHTELIKRGKVPNPIEFGHRVLVIQDKAGFIIKRYIMDHTTDEKVLITIMKELQESYGGKIKSASFDKGFYTPDNRIELEKLVILACLPKKGRLSQADKEREWSSKFLRARSRHAGIESCIHALGSGNGLALCRDKDKEGYQRYVALGIMARNLQVLGTILLAKAKKRQHRYANAA